MYKFPKTSNCLHINRIHWLESSQHNIHITPKKLNIKCDQQYQSLPQMQMQAQLQKHRANQSKRSNMVASNSRADFNNSNSNDQSDYEIVIEFELRREREKTRILEERLHNKEVFIQQMKEYQDQLTLAYEKCQDQLIGAKKALDKFYMLEKNYIQEIQDLKHLVIRLEDQINLRDKDMNRRHYSSVKQQQPISPFNKKTIRSKTLMNNEQSPKAFTDSLQEQVMSQSKRISKFLKQFLMMVSCFSSAGVDKAQSLKNRLKVGWKWIKEVVKEWNDLRNDLRNEKEFWDNFISRVRESGKFSKQATRDELCARIVAGLRGK